jgi:hypothetical protein
VKTAKIGEAKIVKSGVRHGRGCSQGHHVVGVCAHPGSKPSAAKTKIASRKAGKAARAARRANR